MGSNLANLSWNLTQRPTLESNEISRRELNKDGFLLKQKIDFKLKYRVV